jgi:hypothetical protein
VTDHQLDDHPTRTSEEMGMATHFNVRVHWADGTSHDDGIRGKTRDEAQRNGDDNWIRNTPGEKALWVEVVDEASGPWTGPMLRATSTD